MNNMKTHLTIKHLAPYLPYKLKLGNPKNYVFGGSKIDCQEVTLDGLRGDYLSFIEVTCFYPINHFKPILRPLSDLTKPIKVPGYNDGKEFVPIIELAKITNDWIKKEDFDKIYFNHSSGVFDAWFKTASPDDEILLVIEEYDLHSQPYKVMTKLFEWHFAIDIPEGSWRDINTL